MQEPEQDEELRLMLLNEGCAAHYTTTLLYKNTLYRTTVARYEQSLTVFARLTPDAMQLLARAVENLRVPDWESAEDAPETPQDERKSRLLLLRYDFTTVEWLANEGDTDYARPEPLLLLLRQFPTKPLYQMLTRPRYGLRDPFGTLHTIDRAPFFIGRNSTICRRFLGMTLAGRRISRIHAALVPQGDKLFVRDEGSKNGTCYEGQYLRPGTLYEVIPGGEISIGEWTFTVELL